jgi:hypothetical protein
LEIRLGSNSHASHLRISAVSIFYLFPQLRCAFVPLKKIRILFYLNLIYLVSFSIQCETGGCNGDRR